MRGTHDEQSPLFSYVDLLPADDYVTTGQPINDRRFRVRNNVLGTADFSPVVRQRTAMPSAPSVPELIDKARATLASVTDAARHERALSYAYLSETRSSFEMRLRKQYFFLPGDVLDSIEAVVRESFGLTPEDGSEASHVFVLFDPSATEVACCEENSSVVKIVRVQRVRWRCYEFWLSVNAVHPPAPDEWQPNGQLNRQKQKGQLARTGLSA